jgi:hypothetical protein
LLVLIWSFVGSFAKDRSKDIRFRPKRRAEDDANTHYLVWFLSFVVDALLKREVEPMATKTDRARSQTRTTKLLESIQTASTELVMPLYEMCMSVPQAQRISATWNASVLAFVVWALEQGVAVSAIYSVIAETLAQRVANVGRDDGLGAEQITALRERADNTVSQLNGPFWTVALTVELETAKHILAVADEDGTWSAVRGFARSRVESLAFDPSRGKTLVHYTPKGSAKEVSFSVTDAIASRDAYAEAVALADSIKAENSARWSAVSRRFRADNPAGMLDKRTQADRDKEYASVGAAVMAVMSQEEIAKLVS